MKKTFIFSSAVVVFFILHGELIAQEFLMKYKFPNGSEWKFKKYETTVAHIAGPGGLEQNIDRKTEALLKIRGLSRDDRIASYLFIQDTIFIDEAKNETMGFRISDLFNRITNKRIQVDLFPNGNLKNISMLDPIIPAANAPLMLSDSILSQQALLFPTLPDKSIRIGESWTDARSDTASPKIGVAGMGTTDGLTIRHQSTSYTVSGKEKMLGFNCIKLTWKSTIKSESQMTIGETEMYTEEDANAVGTLYFAIAEGIIVSMELKQYSDNTTAMYSGNENTTLPSSTTSETKLILIPTP